MHAHESERGIGEQRVRRRGRAVRQGRRCGARRTCGQEPGTREESVAGSHGPATGSALVRSSAISPRPTPAGDDASASAWTPPMPASATAATYAAIAPAAARSRPRAPDHRRVRVRERDGLATAVRRWTCAAAAPRRDRRSSLLRSRASAAATPARTYAPGAPGWPQVPPKLVKPITTPLPGAPATSGPPESPWQVSRPPWGTPAHSMVAGS